MIVLAFGTGDGDMFLWTSEGEILEESRSESGPTPITDMETATETEVDVGGVMAEGQKLLDGEIPMVKLRDMLALP